jgi:hypothetical protein
MEGRGDHQTLGVHAMTTESTHPYWGIRREELHEAKRRAHAERAKVVRQMFAALAAWRAKRRAAAQLIRAHTFLPPAV